MAASAVAVNTAPLSIPDAPNTLGRTARMYAIVINVVIPAITSVFASVWFSFRWNHFSSTHFVAFHMLPPCMKLGNEKRHQYYI